MRSNGNVSVIVFLGILVVISVTPLGVAQVEELHKDCAGLSAPGHYPDYEPAPHYWVERHEYTSTKPAVLVLQISVPTEAFGGAAIVRLACKLSSDFPKENNIQALIFDDRKAARNLATGLTDQSHYGTYLWHLRGRYELDRERKLHFVEFVSPQLQDQLLGVKRYKIWLSATN